MYQKRSSAPEALLLRLLLFRGRFFASLLGCLRVTLGAPTAGLGGSGKRKNSLLTWEEDEELAKAVDVGVKPAQLRS